MKSILKRLFKKKEEVSGPNNLTELFRFKYANFKELLNSNTDLGRLLAEISLMLEGKKVFGMAYVRSRAAMAVSHAQRMVRALNAISGNGYPSLSMVLEQIKERMEACLVSEEKRFPEVVVVPLNEITKDMVDLVGGKSANLGEACTKARVPVPEGFAITTYAFKLFMEANDLFDLIEKKKLETDPSDPQRAQELSEEIQALILRAELPPLLKDSIMEKFYELESKVASNGPLKVAMRSSALGEDSDLSFAGQYVSILNVTKERLFWAYKVILASLYTPRAIAYRHNMGLRDEDVYMAVACIRMVESRSSGVLYTRDPSNPKSEYLVINSVWGLGPYAVDGTIEPDTFYVSRTSPHTLLEAKIPKKPKMLVMGEDGKLLDQEVPLEKEKAPSISEKEASSLAKYGMDLEKHFGSPQDIEWTIDQNGNTFILQSRPLKTLEDYEDQDEIKIDAPLLIEGGEAAYKGVGSGIAYHVRKEEDLVKFPEGGVLVARHSLPEYAVVIPIAAAIVTDVGSITGHMASIAREFKVPCLLNTKIATQVIPNNEEITVDSRRLKVYKGKIHEISKEKTNEKLMVNTPVYNTLRCVSEYIIPLNLTNPKEANFSPNHIKTIHDLMRFVHEKSYIEMFKLSDSISDGQENTYKIKAQLPIDLYVIDLGGGLVQEVGLRKHIDLNEIACEPLKILLDGMLKERETLSGPRPVDFKGFLSVLTEQMLSAPNLGAERFGDRSYAIISDKYMNFSSRVGYHYSILDSYCGDSLVKNYITFYFIGGAADEIRRSRRAKAIGLILEHLGFDIEVTGDAVNGRYLKYPKSETLQRLFYIGKLLEYTRQMDMLMDSESAVVAFSKKFIESL